MIRIYHTLLNSLLHTNIHETQTRYNVYVLFAAFL